MKVGTDSYDLIDIGRVLYWYITIHLINEVASKNPQLICSSCIPDQNQLFWIFSFHWVMLTILQY